MPPLSLFQCHRCHYSTSKAGVSVDKKCGCTSVLNVAGCKRTLFSLKPLPGLIFCLSQLRGSEDTDNMKRHCSPSKQGKPLAVNELWDVHNGNFVDGTACMTQLIQDAAQDRQGRVTSSPLHGQNLLAQWCASANVVSVSSVMKSRISFWTVLTGPDGLRFQEMDVGGRYDVDLPASWTYEIIDVVGSNCKFYSPKGIRCSSK